MARLAATEKMKTLKEKMDRVKAAGKLYKFRTRYQTRCMVCGRARSVFRKFGLCRICFRQLAHKGVLPGVTKSSW